MTTRFCEHCNQSSFVEGQCGCRRIFYRVEGQGPDDVWHESKSNFALLLIDDFTPLAELAAQNAYRRMGSDDEETFTVFVKRRDSAPKKYIVEATFPPSEIEFDAREVS